MHRLLPLALLLAACGPAEQDAPLAPLGTLEVVRDTIATLAEEPAPLGVDTTIFRTIPVNLEGRMAQVSFHVRGDLVGRAARLHDGDCFVRRHSILCEIHDRWSTLLLHGGQQRPRGYCGVSKGSF